MVDATENDEALKVSSHPEKDVDESVMASTMVDTTENDEAAKLISNPEKDVDESVMASTKLSNMEKQEPEHKEEDEDEDDEDHEEGDEYEYDEEEEEEDEYEDNEDGKEPGDEGEEDVNIEGRTSAVVNGEGISTSKEQSKGKAIGEEKTNKENNVKLDAVKGGAEKKDEVQKNGKELGENSKKKEKRPRPTSNKKKVEQKSSGALVANGDKPESSGKKNASKRVESMGMVFMCSSKTKTDCFHYKVLGLPASKKDQVAKIYKGMRLFLFDVDLRLMYGIFKAAGPGGYNIEPKAFDKGFPSQVRFTMLDDCLPVAEEKFKQVLKENYYARNKFDGLLNAEQVKKLCKLFVVTSKGGQHPKTHLKPLRTRAVESRRSRADAALASRDQRKRKRRSRSREERRPRSPPRRERRRYTDYERPPILYEREPPVPRYLPLPAPVVASPVRSYAYERPLDPYARHHVPEHDPYRALDIEARHHDEILIRERDRVRERDAYHVYSREAPPYRDTVYALPPEYRLGSRGEYLPPAVQPPEYRLSGGGHVPIYRDVAPAAPDYHSHQSSYRY